MLFAYDLVDEGYDTVLDNVANRGGLGGISMATAYHHGRDIFPHNPVRKVRFLEGGTVFFRPDFSLYGSLRPQPSRLTEDADVLEDAVAAASALDLTVNAWTVYCHNTGLGSKHPELTIHNAFDDPYLNDLCPARPEVQEFALALTADIANRGVDSIIVESLHYGLFEHGHHHERYFIDFGNLAKYLFGLCFCEHCTDAGEAAGADVERLKAFVVESLGTIFEGGPPLEAPELDESEVRSMADGEMGRFLDSRAATVTSLSERAADVARDRGVRFEFIDPSGAMKGYATGLPTGPPAAESAWMMGCDIAGIGAAADVMAIGYASDPERVRFDLDAYQKLLSGDSRLTVAMRPMVPDCDSVENLIEKLQTARAARASRVDFYHYGFMPLTVLDRVRAAMDGS